MGPEATAGLFILPGSHTWFHLLLLPPPFPANLRCSRPSAILFLYTFSIWSLLYSYNKDTKNLSRSPIWPIFIPELGCLYQTRKVDCTEQCFIFRSDTLIGIAYHFGSNIGFSIQNALIMLDVLSLDVIQSPHKSLNTSDAIIIFPHSLDFSRDKEYLCEINTKTIRNETKNCSR